MIAATATEALIAAVTTVDLKGDKADITVDHKADKVKDPRILRAQDNLHRKEAVTDDITKESQIPQTA